MASTSTPAKPTLKILPCIPADASLIARGLYTCFPAEWWARKEPPERAPTSADARTHSLAQRILPTITHTHTHWLKAVTPSGEVAGIACWRSPGAPVHGLFRRDATTRFGWAETMGWSDADLDAMWSHVAGDKWNGTMEKDDECRAAVLDGEPHWYLTPLFVWPQWQGKGVASALLRWAFEQADATEPPTPIYLESQPSSMALYEHVGFQWIGENRFLRRGPSDARVE
jgi:GNAT superfamily N-acetyltransferase